MNIVTHALTGIRTQPPRVLVENELLTEEVFKTMLEAAATVKAHADILASPDPSRRELIGELRSGTGAVLATLRRLGVEEEFK